MPRLSIDTRFGHLTLTDHQGAISRVEWGGTDDGAITPLLREAARQILEYEAGNLTRFDLPIRLDASPFQRAVCAAMQAIPYGETRTYGEIARDLGQSPQAVGRGCGGNPIPIIIPCHRVMGADGKLVGFSGGGGVETKVDLLRHEGAAGLLI